LDDHTQEHNCCEHCHLNGWIIGEYNWNQGQQGVPARGKGTKAWRSSRKSGECFKDPKHFNVFGSLPPSDSV